MRDLDKPAAVFDELRDLAVAALALPDFREAAMTLENGWPEGSVGLDFDPVALRFYARGDQQGNVSVRRLEDDEEAARLPGSGKARYIIFSADARCCCCTIRILGCWKLDDRWPCARDSRDDLQRRGPLAAEPRRAPAVGVPQVTYGALVRGHRGALRCRLIERRKMNIDMWSKGRPALSPDGRWLAYVENNEVLVFDVDVGTQVGKLVNREPVFSPAWHPDSRTLAVGSDGNNVYVWDVPSGSFSVPSTTRRGRTGGDHELFRTIVG